MRMPQVSNRRSLFVLFGAIICLALSGCPQVEDNTPEEKNPNEEIPEEENPGEGDTENETTGRFNPGTYSAQAAGYGGPLSITTTFSDNSIDQIAVTSHSETSSRPAVQTALTTIPQAIITAQRLNIDAVSGATRTSNAIKNAVEACVVKAGANPSDLKGTP
jgi:uncharacterized protein with FMN-binding domain